ncbi:MAG: hypothetical protein V4651_10320 [Bacteroidota bacterium]
MKLKLLVVLFCLCTVQSFSQIRKGQWLAGGSSVFSYDETKYSQSYSSQLNTQTAINFGYFIFNRVAIGMNVNFTYFKDNSPTTGYGYSGYLTSTVGGSTGPFIRGYFLPVTSRMNFMLQGGYQFGITKATIINPYYYYGYREISSINRTHNFMIAGGPVFVLNPNVTLELLIAYNLQKLEASTLQTNSFLKGIGFQIHLGKGKQAAEKAAQ